MDQPPESSLPSIKSRWQQFRARLGRLLPFFLTALFAFAAFMVFYWLAIRPRELTGEYVSETIARAMASATPAPAYSAQVYKIIQPSLVLIQTRSPHEGQDDDFGLGSGVVIDQAGSILTSLHVVAGADAIELTFADGTQSAAQVTASQPENDIAVLQAEKLPTVLVPAVLGNPGSMRVGDEAFVVGNPFGLYSSMSAGVISGFDRSFQPPKGEFELKGLIQVDAAVNPGNSGGPLLNRDGFVIGIVTGIVNPTKENFFVGIGFAVPITVAVGGTGSPPF
jgi:S1-C subfamily serine protease